MPGSLHKRVRTAANGDVVVVASKISCGIDMLRKHEHVSEARELSGEPLAEDDFGRVVVDGACAREVQLFERPRDLNGLRARIGNLA